MSAFAAEDAARQSSDVGVRVTPVPGTGYRVPVRGDAYSRVCRRKNYAALDNFYKIICIISAFSTGLDGNIPEICCLKLDFPVDLYC